MARYPNQKYFAAPLVSYAKPEPVSAMIYTKKITDESGSMFRRAKRASNDALSMYMPSNIIGY
ncbi:hypothetical protein GCM10009413_27100 [Tatumella punctata]